MVGTGADVVDICGGFTAFRPGGGGAAVLGDPFVCSCAASTGSLSSDARLLSAFSKLARLSWRSISSSLEEVPLVAVVVWRREFSSEVLDQSMAMRVFVARCVEMLRCVGRWRTAVRGRRGEWANIIIER